LDENKLMSWVTEKLINSIFPEMRKKAYEHTIVEEDNLGTYDVEYTQVNIDADTIMITK